MSGSVGCRDHVCTMCYHHVYEETEIVYITTVKQAKKLKQFINLLVN